MSSTDAATKSHAISSNALLRTAPSTSAFTADEPLATKTSCAEQFDARKGPGPPRAYTTRAPAARGRTGTRSRAARTDAITDRRFGAEKSTARVAFTGSTSAQELSEDV
jgi:hypothetical protein